MDTHAPGCYAIEEWLVCTTVVRPTVIYVGETCSVTKQEDKTLDI